jgi:hypothetical protein
MVNSPLSGIGSGLSVTSASILRTVLDTVTFNADNLIEFSGSVTADEDSLTNYYTLATTRPDLSKEHVVNLMTINAYTSNASLSGSLAGNYGKFDYLDTVLPYVVDLNEDAIYASSAVNKAYVYTYAIDVSGSNNHRDIKMKVVGGTEVDAVVLDSDKIFPDANLDPHTTIVNNYIVSDIFTLAGSGTIASTSVGGFHIDLIPENVGDVYDFEYYWDIPDGNTTYMHGGFSLTSTGEPTATATPSRRHTDPGYYIDFFENLPPESVVRWVTLNEVGSGYTTPGSTHGGLEVIPPNGRLHKNRYFRATLVSGTTPPVDIQLELFEDEARTKLAWKTNKWSSGTLYTALTATQVYFNFWMDRRIDYVAGQNHYFGNIIKNGEQVLVPYVKYDTIVQPTSANSGLTISDATVFSSVADIDNYYAFNLVTGVPAAVVASEPHLDPDTLTDAQIVTFVQTYLQANITADGWNTTDGSLFGITTGTTVYSGGYTNNIMQYAVEEVPSLTFTYAFNTLTPSTTADISQITNVAEWAFQTYVIAVDTAQRYGLRAESGRDPFADVASLSFRMSSAIADLANRTYTSSDTLTYNETTITSGGGVHSWSPAGYIIGTDVNGRKYMTTQVESSFGIFSIGGSFTIAFVLSTKGLSADRLTFGISPFDQFNFHFGSSVIGLYPINFPLTGLAASQVPNYSNADYCLFLVSFNGQMTTILRTNTNHSFHITVGGGISGTFTLVSGADPIRIYDMLIFPGEYMNEDRVTYPIFGIIEDYVNKEYGIVIP